MAISASTEVPKISADAALYGELVAYSMAMNTLAANGETHSDSIHPGLRLLSDVAQARRRAVWQLERARTAISWPQICDLVRAAAAKTSGVPSGHLCAGLGIPQDWSAPEPAAAVIARRVPGLRSELLRGEIPLEWDMLFNLVFSLDKVTRQWGLDPVFRGLVAAAVNELDFVITEIRSEDPSIHMQVLVRKGFTVSDLNVAGVDLDQLVSAP